MIVPFEPEHLLQIRHQEQQKHAINSLEHARAVAMGYCAWTALDDRSKKPLICAGIIELWPGRAMCWASLDFAAKPVMLGAHRHALQELDRSPFKRLEMYVLPDFFPALRWAQMLRFEYESCMEKASPDGRDLLVFKRIKRGAVARRLA